MTEKSRYCDFGPFRLDRQSRVLLRDNVIVPLTPKVFDTLAALVDRPGEVVSKEELLRAVWPDSFVEESNLAQNVSVLRKTLGDATYVETVPKRGYRFAYPVPHASADHSTGFAAPHAAPPQPEASSPPAAPRRRFWLLLAAAIPLALAIFLFQTRSDSQPNIRSLAVLPLKNLSGTPADDYFADGITELLTEQLSRRLPLRVVSRTSAARYRDSAKPLHTIGSELGVDALIEGSVARAGDRVRVTVKLIDSSSDRHLWADTYDRDLADVLVFQKEIAQAVATEIHSGMLGADDRPPAVVRAGFDAYIRARYHWNLRTAPNLAEAISWFQKALEQDPVNARAYAGLADCYNQLGTVMIGAQSPMQTRKLAAGAARRALELDPNLAEAHAALGYVHLYDWNWDRAQAELNRAIQLNPNYPSAHLWLAHYHSIHGRFQEALQQVLLARDLDPMSPIAETQRGWLLIHARRFKEAIQVLRAVGENFPGYQWAAWQLGMALAHDGNPHAAVSVLEQAAGRNRTHAFLGFLGYAYGRAGRRDDALRVLGELRSEAKRVYVSPHAFMFVYMGLQDRDNAFESLEQSFAERSNGVAWMAVAPDYDVLRPDRRFNQLLARLGLPSVPAH